MIKTKKELNRILKLEKNNYGIKKFWRFLSFFGYSEKCIIWRYQQFLRKWEYHLNANHSFRSIFYKTRTNKLGRKYGIQIGPNCFDAGLTIFHLGSIVINNNVRAGKNCKLHVNTAMAATNGTADAPQLGDDCALGIGSILVGGIKLGNQVVVGAGAVVTKSFELDHVTLGGVPAKVISHNALI